MLFIDFYFSVLDKTWFKVYKMVDPSKLSELLITAVDSTVRKLQLIQIGYLPIWRGPIWRVPNWRRNLTPVV
jgi:hypothetical protein